MYGEKYIFMAIIFHKNLRVMKRRYGWRAGCILWKLEIKPCQSKKKKKKKKEKWGSLPFSPALPSTIRSMTWLSLERNHRNVSTV
jgi:hypothetical protein